MSASPDSPRPTRDQVLRAVARQFPSVDPATVLGILDQYGPDPHHRERERVHLAIVRLSRGNLGELRKLVGYAQRDYRDLLYWTELAQGYHDPSADRLTDAVLTPEATPRRLAVLKEVVPTAVHVAVLWNPGYRSHDAQLAALEATARDLQVALQPVGVQCPTDFDGAVATMRSGRAEAVLVLTSTMLRYHWADLAERALAGGLPAMGELREFAVAGGLLTYGPSAAVRQERAVGQVGHLVRTLKREPLPEAPDTRATAMELVVNLKTANALGLTIPPSLLRRADDLIR